MQTSDLFIIGGGINGTAIAAEAAKKGLSVVLSEKNLLGSGTSSASTKLIHGGLRYLESGEWGLVRESLQERDRLLREAPHLVKPLRFIMPQRNKTRPVWLLRLGFFIYDHFSRHNHLPASSYIDLTQDKNLLPFIQKGFSYYDGVTNDLSLVERNAMIAEKNHALLLTQSECISAERKKNHWKIDVKNSITQETGTYYAKMLINAAGPWVKRVHETLTSTLAFDIELVKGSHIIVPKLYDEHHAYALQNEDRRIVFAIPYQSDFTLIGTTDRVVHSPDETGVCETEKQYLCDAINAYFRRKISPCDIISCYSGIRCLQKKPRKKSCENDTGL